MFRRLTAENLTQIHEFSAVKTASKRHAHDHSRMNLQFRRLRASLEGRTMLPKVNANVEEKTRADAVPETGDGRPLRVRARISWQPD